MCTNWKLYINLNTQIQQTQTRKIDPVEWLQAGYFVGRQVQIYEIGHIYATQALYRLDLICCQVESMQVGEKGQRYVHNYMRLLVETYLIVSHTQYQSLDFYLLT